jgi:hypothetical protein
VVEVSEGLKEGEQVVINPVPLLVGENSKLKAGVPQIKQQGEGGGPEGGSKKPGKGKGPAKGNGNAPKGVPVVTDEMKAKWEKLSPAEQKAWIEKFKNMKKD